MNSRKGALLGASAIMMRQKQSGKKPLLKRITRTNRMASFDQHLQPRSGFFLELYNPWASNTPCFNRVSFTEVL